MLGPSELADTLLDSHENLCSMEFVSTYTKKKLTPHLKILKSHEEAHVTKLVKCEHLIQYFILISRKTSLANNIYIIPPRKLNCLSQEHLYISNYFNT